MNNLRALVVVIPLVAATTTLSTVQTAVGSTPGTNGRIVWATQLDTGYQLITMRPDGSHLTQITNHPQVDSINPDWSSDGRSIVYETDTATRAGVAVADRDGKHQRAVRPQGLAGFTAQPAFTPDGRHIVFERVDPAFVHDNIWVMNGDASGVRRLTNNPFSSIGGFDTDPNVSPNGKVVSFVRVKVADAKQALFSVRLDGTHLRQLTPYSYDVAIKHDWAPDGKHIVITVYSNPADPKRSANIATLRPDGSHFRLLTHFHGRNVNAFVGSYSPDGRWIVYRTETRDSRGTLGGGLFGLFKIHPWGGTPQLVAALIGRPRYIDWGPQPRSG